MCKMEWDTEGRGCALPLLLLLASPMSRGHCQKQCNRQLTCLLSSFSAWLPNRWGDLSFCSTVSSKHPVTRCYKHVSFFGGFGQHCLQERRDITGCSNQPTTGFPCDCVSVCQNHRWGTWRTISNHSSSMSEQSWWWPALLLGQIHQSELRPSRAHGCFWMAVERISLGNQKNSKRYMWSTVMHIAKAATWVYSNSAMSFLLSSCPSSH